MRITILVTILLSVSYIGLTQVIPLRLDDLSRTFPFDARAYDSAPSMVQSDDGTIWISWHVFLADENTEMVLLRSFKDGKPGRVFEVTDKPGIYSDPEIILSNEGNLWVFWSENFEDNWILNARSIRNNEMGETTTLSSDKEYSTLKPNAINSDNGLYVSWTTYKDEKFQIVYRKYSKGQWGNIQLASDPNLHSFRPSLSKDSDGNIWTFWDSYKDGKSFINGRKIYPVQGSINQLSGPGDRYYNAVSSYSEYSGLCVAWVKIDDIIGGHGAIDQQYSFEMATRKGQNWELVKDASGNSNATLITRGLLAKIDPEPEPTGGYLGQRVHPMLLESEGYLWLFWERKSKQSGSTFLIKGDLIGRRFNGNIWEDTKVFLDDYVDYRISNEAKAIEGEFYVIGSDLPEYGTQQYKYFKHSLKDFEQYEQEAWRGWTTTSLPLPVDEKSLTHKISEDGKTLNLYWIDSHVHSDLSTDAEGPIDQVIFYARDRAKIDAIVTQENDYFLTPLTNYDYTLGKFFSSALTDKNFLALHGFEWTSRLPSEDNIRPNTPFVWGANYPNHRTVIYPDKGGPLIRFTDVDNDINKLNKIVNKYGGVTIAQHPRFKLSHDSVEVAVEAAAGWGTYLSKPKFIHSNLNDGFKFGFVGVTDSHRRNPGLNGGITGIYAEDLSASSIIEAYKSRRFFATNGSKIILEARADEQFMGTELITQEKVELSLNVISPKPIISVSLIRNGEELKTFNSHNIKEENFKYIDTNLEKGEYWYYWRVEIDGYSTHYGGNVMVAKGNLAWSTPNWVIIE